MKMLRAVLFVLLCVLSVQNAIATPFRIQNIEVETQADSVADAKKQALVQARKKAFDEMIKKMVDPKQIDYFSKIEDETIEFLIDSVQVVKETVGSKAYKTTISFYFNKDRIESFLKTKTVEFVVPVNKTMVLIPVLSDGAKTYLFEKENPWFRVWQQASLNQALCTLIVPNGDLTDIHTVGAEDAIIGATHRLQEIAGRYKASSIVVMHVSLVRSEDKLQANIDFQEYDSKGIKKQTSMKGRELVYTVEEKTKEDIFNDFFKVAMNNIQTSIRADFGAAQPQNELYLKLPTPTTEAYVKYMQLIKDSAMVSEISPMQISKTHSIFRVKTVYTVLELQAYLRSHGHTIQISDKPISEEVHNMSFKR